MARKGIVKNFLDSVTGDDDDDNEGGGLRDVVKKGVEAAKESGIIGDGKLVDKVAERAKEFVTEKELGDGSLIDKGAKLAKEQLNDDDEKKDDEKDDEKDDDTSSKAEDSKNDDEDAKDDKDSDDDDNGVIDTVRGFAKGLLNRDKDDDGDEDDSRIGGLIDRGLEAAGKAGIIGDGQVIDKITDKVGDIAEERGGDGSLIERGAAFAKEKLGIEADNDVGEDPGKAAGKGVADAAKEAIDTPADRQTELLERLRGEDTDADIVDGTTNAVPEKLADLADDIRDRVGVAKGAGAPDVAGDDLTIGRDTRDLIRDRIDGDEPDRQEVLERIAEARLKLGGADDEQDDDGGFGRGAVAEKISGLAAGGAQAESQRSTILDRIDEAAEVAAPPRVAALVGARADNDADGVLNDADVDDDNDGVIDSVDIDDDNDGLLDQFE